MSCNRFANTVLIDVVSIGGRGTVIVLLLLQYLVAVVAWGDEVPRQDVAHSSAESSIVGKSFAGRPLWAVVHGDGPDVLMVIATIHGNEGAGTPLVEAFSRWLTAHPEQLVGRRVVIIPVANPDGFAEGQRFNARGVDLNRNFPAGNWREEKVNLHGLMPLSEPESRVLLQWVCHYFPNRVVSIHQPLKCIDYDGPGQRLAAAMAAKCSLPVKKLGGRPGSLGSFIGETLGKPIITLELPQDAGRDSEVLWRLYGESLIAALQYPTETTAE